MFQRLRIFASSVLSLGLGLIAIAGSGVLHAQSPYPQQPIRFIVPYAAGGLPDVVIRTVGARLQTRLGQPVVVENRPGAGGVAAAQAMLSSPPDGYTFVFSDAAMLSIAPHIINNLPYDTLKDFKPVSYVARAPNFVAVGANVQAKNMGEFVALAKQRPGVLTCGSSGIGSMHHLTLELIKAALEIDVVHVPFRGSGQSVPALLGGQIDCLLASLPPLKAAVASGRARILAVAGTRVSDTAPDTPPIGAAMGGFDSAFILGALARKDVPDEIVNRINREISLTLEDPEVLKFFFDQGVEPIGGTPARFQQALAEDAKQMGAAIKLAKIK